MVIEGMGGGEMENGGVCLSDIKAFILHSFNSLVITGEFSGERGKAGMENGGV